jgi:hypothetical protein
MVQPRSATAAIPFGVSVRLGRFALPAILVAAVAVWGLVALAVSSPWIYVDELIYSDLARSIAAGGPPAVRGVTSYGYGLGYPLVISPAWALLREPSSAYVLARLINAFVMCSAAVPAYLLARHFVSRRSALIVAALTVTVPSMVYVTAIMTEVAFYPLFLWALLAIQRALEVPSARRQAVVLVAIGAAAATKILAIGLFPAYLVAVALIAGSRSAWLRSTRVALAAAAGATVLLVVAHGGSPVSVFGAYSGAVRHVDVASLPLSIARHIGALLLYTAMIPVVATAVVVGQGLLRGADAKARSLAALVVTTVLATVGGVAVFAVYATSIDFATTGVPAAMPVYERNLFVVAPLFLIGLAVWIERGCPRPRPLTPVVSACAVVVMALYPWSQVVRESASPQNLATTPWVVTPLPTGVLWVVVAVVSALIVALWLRIDPTRTRRLWAIVGVWFAFVGLVSFAVFRGTAAESSRDGVGASPGWIDHAVGRNGRVTIVWPEPSGREFALPTNRQRVVWASDFFNRSVVGVVSIGAKLPFGLPDRLVRARADGALVDASGRPIRAQYVLAPCSLRIAAPVTAVDRRVRAVVYRPAGIVRIGGESACPEPVLVG